MPSTTRLFQGPKSIIFLTYVNGLISLICNSAGYNDVKSGKLAKLYYLILEWSQSGGFRIRHTIQDYADCVASYRLTGCHI